MNPQIDARSRRWLLEEPNGGFESHLTTAPAGSSPSALGSPQDPETGNALSAPATTVGGLLAICWQPASQRGPRKAYVLVGVTGIEPVTSAV
jgi:hypothetical protein